MARDGSGVYSLPAGNPVVTGTDITDTWANTTLNDIATELTNSVAKDGRTTLTANLPFGGFKGTGLAAGAVATDSVRLGQTFVNGDTSVTLTASSSDISAQLTSTHILLTGTGVTVTAFVAGTAGHWKRVRFDGVNTLTHSASFALPGSANITTAAGDEAEFHYTSAGWVCAAYHRNSGQGLIARSGTWELLRTVSPTSGANVDFVNGTSGVVLTSAYTSWRFEFRKLRASGTQAFYVQTTSDGTTWDAGASDYRSETITLSSGGAVAAATSLGTLAYISGSVSSTAADGGLTGVMEFYDPTAAHHFLAQTRTLCRNAATGLTVYHGGFARLAAADVVGFRFGWGGAATFAAGTIALYGRKA